MSTPHEINEDNSVSVVILGAGMSGLCMGIALKRAGIHDFTILEKARGIGGTWWDNSYPGAQCDVPSHLYSFSFEPKADWSRSYAPQAEIQEYMQHCAEKYGLTPHIRCNETVMSARFDAERSEWAIRTGSGETIKAHHFVCSSGPLSQPRLPDIPGLDSFAGKIFHTSRWDHSYEFRGKRVAVIGNAASGVQLVPQIAPRVTKLSVFQRSANWILPRPDRAYSALEKQLFRIPLIARLHRAYFYFLQEQFRKALNPGSRPARIAAHMAMRHLDKQVPDRTLRAALRPDYPMGCKRVLISNDYYPALLRDNVELVTSAIVRIGTNGIVTRDGRTRALDAIVCATGFNAAQMLASVQIEGARGHTLSDSWKTGAEAYHGLTVAGFPNFFLLLGPNTGTGHTSTLLFIEAQVRYILRCIEELRTRGQSQLDVRPEAMAAQNEDLQRVLAKTVWAQGCGSWYKTPQGKIVALYPGYSFQYVAAVKRPKFEDYVFGQAIS